MKTFRNLLSSGGHRSITLLTALSLTGRRFLPRFKTTTDTKFSTTTMPPYQRVAIHRNPKYKHNGTKSYVYAMSKCTFYHSITVLTSSSRTYVLLDGFNTTKPGPYFYAKAFESQGKFGGQIGGRMRTHHVLRKRHPKSQGTINPEIHALITTELYSRSSSFQRWRCATSLIRSRHCGRSDC